MEENNGLPGRSGALGKWLVLLRNDWRDGSGAVSLEFTRCVVALCLKFFAKNVWPKC